MSLALYDFYRATARFVSPDGRTIQFESGLTAGDASSTPALNAVPAIRAELTRVQHNIGATASGVAGEAPALYDVSSISDSDLIHIVPIAIIAIGHPARARAEEPRRPALSHRERHALLPGRARALLHRVHQARPTAAA